VIDQQLKPVPSAVISLGDSVLTEDL